VKLTRIRQAPDATPELLELSATFLHGAGEQEALRLMQDNPGAMLLTDDATARLVAQSPSGWGTRSTARLASSCEPGDGSSEPSDKCSTSCAFYHDDQPSLSSNGFWMQ
jgi:hypothetical protein